MSRQAVAQPTLKLPRAASPAQEPAIAASLPVAGAETERWGRWEQLLAVAGVVLIAARVDLRYLFTAGDLLALVTLPMWLPNARRYVGAPVVLAVGGLALGSGVLLTYVRSADHEVSAGGFITEMSLMLSLLVSFGFLLWARERMEIGVLAALFGFGLLFGLPLSNPLFPGNPWKYGVGFAISILALGFAHRLRRPFLELVIVAVLALAAALTDFRSAFAILALVGALVIWQARPTGTSRRASVARTLLSVVVVGAVVYNLAQALILRGLFGEETRTRTEQQLETAGSLLLGGRPELAATAGLMWHDIFGLGPGVRANFEEIEAAKVAMQTIAYDPNNGYVENWMFGRGVSLHSVTGDLWARFGLMGLVFIVVVLVLMAHRFGHLLAVRGASGLELLLGVYVFWNLFFEPFYSSLTKLILLFGLLVRRRAGEAVLDPQSVRGLGEPPQSRPPMSTL